MKKLIYAVIIIGIQHLTINNQHSFGQAPFATPDNVASGNCLDFDGSNDYVDFGNNSSLNVTGDFTIQGWIKLSSDVVDERVFLSKGNAFNDRGYIMSMVPGRNIKIYTGSGSWIGRTSSNVLDINQWYHVAWVHRAGVDEQLYLNGVLETMNSLQDPIYTGFDILSMGAYFNNGTTLLYFPGQMEEVSIWDIARTQAQIQDNMCVRLTGAETGLVGYWNMNEGTGNTVGDLTTNNNDGTRQ